MCTINAPHRHDTVGSFLRTEKLKKARNDFEKGKLTRKNWKKLRMKKLEKLWISKLN